MSHSTTWGEEGEARRGVGGMKKMGKEIKGMFGRREDDTRQEERLS